MAEQSEPQTGQICPVPHPAHQLRLTAGVVCALWLATKALVRFKSALLVHTCLAAIFIGAGVWLVRWVIPNFTSYCTDHGIPVNRFSRKFSAGNAVQLIIKKPTSRLGIAICMSYMALSVLVFAWSCWTQGVQTSTVLALEPLSQPSAVWSSVVAPFYEEFFFRGALILVFIPIFKPVLGETRTLFWAVYVNALVFWIFHLPLQADAWQAAWRVGGIPAGPGPFLLGLVAAFIALKDRSFWAAFGLHAMANSFGGVWAPLLSGTGLFHYFYF